MEMNTGCRWSTQLPRPSPARIMAWQLAVAEGKPLPLTQEQVVLRGHAVEAPPLRRGRGRRFSASERPHPLAHLAQQVRIDTGVTAGDEVSPYYDPMIAKLVAHAPSRSEALPPWPMPWQPRISALWCTNGPLLQRLCERQRCWRCATTPSGPFPPTPARSGAAWPSPPSGSPLASAMPPWQQAAGFRLGPTRRFAPRCASAGRPHSPLAERGAPCSGRASRSRLELGSDQIRLYQGGHWQRYPGAAPRRGRLFAAPGGQAHPLLAR